MKAGERTSQLVMVTGFLALSFLFDIRILAYIALGLGLVFLISSTLSKGILWLWWKLAHILGWINSRILLSVVFYAILLPVSMLSKLFTSDPLNIKWKKNNPSFVERNHKYSAADLDNPW